MKKALMAFALCLISALCIAQVSIKKEKPKYDFPIKAYTSFMHCLEDDTYCLVISSDNEYESKCAHIDLGNSEQALVSVNSMLDMVQTDGDYTLGKYSGYVYSKTFFFHHLGDLEFAAGTYSISSLNLKKCKKWLEKNQGGGNGTR